MNRFFATLAISATILTAATEGSCISPYKFYKKLVKKEQIGVVREYYTEQLTAEILENRGDSIIIEKVIGKVTNKRKDGKVIGGDPVYNYISYRKVKGAKKGDIILTLLIYEPGSDGVDDIADRFDYIIDRKGK